MTLDDVKEAVNVLQVALSALQGAVPGQSGRTGAAFRYACGDLLVQAPTLIPAAAIGTPLRACFDQAVVAGATLNGLLATRNAALAFGPVSQAAVTIAGGCLCRALECEAAILATTAFSSSGDALASLAVFSAAVQAAQDWAIDNHLSAQYQALILLGAAVARDLQTRAAPLPRLTTYVFPRGEPSLVLAYRLYGDAGRADELRAENSIVHPAFMPATGSALSE